MTKYILLFSGLVLLGALVFFFTFFPQRTETYVAETNTPSGPVTVMIGAELSREEIAALIGSAFGFTEENVHKFHDTYRSMQWDAFNEFVVPHIVEAHDLDEQEREILLTHSTIYLDTETDILESLYAPGEHTFDADASIVEIAEVLLKSVTATNTEAFVEVNMSGDAISEVLSYVEGERDLLPDLVPLPPQDVGIREEGGSTLLVFSTIYYNKGRGDLELVADPETIGVIGDFDRDVNQRVYRDDGTYRERPSGTFEWHHEHIHYHFTDFVEYRLEGVDNDIMLGSDGLLHKSTFCIRDVSRVFLNDTYASTSAQYRVCGRERQGVTVGWGDAYFSTYPDQNLDITDLPSGTYRLIFEVNPADRFVEVTKENNTSSALLRYDKDTKTVEVLEIVPREIPEFEHIYVEQEFS